MSEKKKHEEEAGGESVGLWYVSFADMITLLLSFFVMLTTFSSYSKEGMNKFAGTCAYIASYSLVAGRPEHSMVPTERAYEQVKEGSEKPTGLEAGEPEAVVRLGLVGLEGEHSAETSFRGQKVAGFQ